jgi:hypothetical protein
MDATTALVPVICVTLGVALAWGRCCALALGALSLVITMVTAVQLSPLIGAASLLIALAEATLIQASYLVAVTALVPRNHPVPEVVAAPESMTAQIVHPDGSA